MQGFNHSATNVWCRIIKFLCNYIWVQLSFNCPDISCWTSLICFSVWSESTPLHKYWVSDFVFCCTLFSQCLELDVVDLAYNNHPSVRANTSKRVKTRLQPGAIPWTPPTNLLMVLCDFIERKCNKTSMACYYKCTYVSTVSDRNHSCRHDSHWWIMLTYKGVNMLWWKYVVTKFVIIQ